MGREEVSLPDPKDEALIRYINSRLKSFNIHPVQMRMKPNKNEVHIRGDPEVIQQRKTQLQRWMDEYYQENMKKKVWIPPEVIGQVIGARFHNINRIRESTGVSIAASRSANAIYVDSSNENYKKALHELRALASNFMYINQSKGYSCGKYDFVNSTEASIFKLSKVECPNPTWNQAACYYKITTADDDEQLADGELNLNELKEELKKVLENIQTGERHDGKLPKGDLWCHFGHIYISGVDEAEEVEEKTLAELQNNFNKERDSWKMGLDPAVKDMEIQSLEKVLEKDCTVTVPRHYRYDLSYVTPLCLGIRVKFFLDLNGDINMEYAKEDIDVREDGNQSSSYVLCNTFYTRAKISIAIPSRSMDVRMTIRTVSPTKQKGPAEEEHENILKMYLDQITVKDGELIFPPEELPEGFSLQFLRKCYRRSYGIDGFNITLSDEELRNVDAGGIISKKTDIHLHNDNWDKLLTSGDWDPDQIIHNLPGFLYFLKDIQENISVPNCEHDNE